MIDMPTNETAPNQRWLLLSRPAVSLWGVLPPLLISALYHQGMPGEVTIGGCVTLAIVWAFGKVEERRRYSVV